MAASRAGSLRAIAFDGWRGHFALSIARRGVLLSVRVALRSMLAFVLRRLVQAVLVMLTVAFIAFMLFQYVGDPVTNILGQDATPQQRQQLRADLGLDQPVPGPVRALRRQRRAAASSASACARGARSRR